MNNAKKAFENRAELTEKASSLHSGCDDCADPILFHLEDNEHEFSIGLTTILSCLALAEKGGHIPKIPYDWWISVQSRYTIPHSTIHERD